MMMSARMMSSVRTTTVLNRSSLLQKRGYAMIAGWGDPLPRTSLGEFFEGVPEQQGLPNLPRAAEVTTLPNGLRVASLSSNFPGVSLGLFVNAGARNETREGAGAAHYLKYMAFRSTTQRYGIEVVRDLEVLGANLSSSVGREHLLFSTEVLPHDVTNTIHQLKELLEPKLAHHEVVRAREHVEEDAERLVSCPITSLIETVHREAYRSKGLGHSIVAPQYNLGNIDNQVLRQFVQSHYSPSQSVFVVVGGVAHKDIVQQVQASFSDAAAKSTSASSSSSAPEASKYTGGDNLTPDSGNTHVAIAFEGVSAKSDVKDVLAAGILRQILGEGMNGANKDNRLSGSSRLTNTVLSSNPSVHSIATFNFVYSDSGLFGVYAETSKNPAELVQTIASELSKLAKSEVDAKELAKGKAMYKAEILTQHGEQRHSALKFIGDQVLTRGKVVTPEEYAKQIDSVTAADLNRVAKKILSSNPTLCASGDVAGFPSSVDVKSFVSSK